MNVIILGYITVNGSIKLRKFEQKSIATLVVST